MKRRPANSNLPKASQRAMVIPSRNIPQTPQSTALQRVLSPQLHASFDGIERMADGRFDKAGGPPREQVLDWLLFLWCFAAAIIVIAFFVGGCGYRCIDIVGVVAFLVSNDSIIW